MTRLLLLALTGCSLYEPPHGDPPACPLDVPGHQYRDPMTGACAFSNDTSCNPSCATCTAPISVYVAMNDSYCEGPCEGLTESACTATPDCHVAYAGDAFAACWTIAPWGSVHGGAQCTTFAATECAEAVDCVSVLAGGVFESCRAR